MSRSSSPFHIQHIARPAHIERILVTVSNGRAFTPESIRLQLIQEGYQITLDGARRSLDLGAKLGIFDRSNHSAYKLTVCGQACRDLALYRREVYCDIMHFLLFATWEFGGHQDYWSWSYAKTCAILWSDSPAIKGRKTIWLMSRTSAESVV